MIVLPDSEIYWRARPDYVPKNLHVDFYGDSILLGVGVKKSPIERIAAVRPHWIIDHHYAGGVTSSNLVTGYDASTPYLSAEYMPFGPQPPFWLIKRQASIVVVQVGYNDALRQDPNFAQNLRAILSKIKSEGRIPVLTGIFSSEHPVELQKEYNDITWQLAQEMSVMHAVWGEITLNNPPDSPDTIHMDQYSSDVLAGSLLTAIEAAIYHFTP